MCGEGTVFDQRQLSCVRQEEATPCFDAPNYYYVNEQFGQNTQRIY